MRSSDSFGPVIFRGGVAVELLRRSQNLRPGGALERCVSGNPDRGQTGIGRYRCDNGRRLVGSGPVGRAAR